MSWSGIVGAFVEAWQEIRIHRTRVTLSLIGVAVAVCAITTVVGLGAIAEQASKEEFERYAGRPVTLSINVQALGEKQPELEDVTAAFHAAAERYKITHVTRAGSTNLRAQFADGVADVNVQLVDSSYAAVHRVPLILGSWFAEKDGAAARPRDRHQPGLP